MELSTSAIIAGRRRPELAALILEHFEPVQQEWREMVVRGISRGEVDTACSPRAVMNMLVSQLVLTPLTLYRPPTDEEVEELVDLVLRATRPVITARQEGAE